MNFRLGKAAGKGTHVCFSGPQGSAGNVAGTASGRQLSAKHGEELWGWVQAGSSGPHLFGSISCSLGCISFFLAPEQYIKEV